MTCRPAVLYLVLQVLWGLVIVSLAVAKINGFAHGTSMFLEHFTNWSWALQGFFYLATVAFVVPATPGRCCNVRCAGHVAALCFLPLNTVVWFVAIAVAVLLFTDPEFITDLFEAMGAGVVIVGNDVFHVLPVLALVLYAYLQTHFLYFSLYQWFVPAANLGDKTARCCAVTWLAVYEAFGGALLIALTYLLVLQVAYGKSINDVYGTDFSVPLGLAMFVAVSLLVSGVPLLIAACCYNLCRRRRYPAVLERRATEARTDVFAYDDDESVQALLEQTEPAPPPVSLAHVRRPFSARDIAWY